MYILHYQIAKTCDGKHTKFYNILCMKLQQEKKRIETDPNNDLKGFKYIVNGNIEDLYITFIELNKDYLQKVKNHIQDLIVNIQGYADNNIYVAEGKFDNQQLDWNKI